jgi:endonuclease/exonuclease/phosphatase family metal-dependent hydrolase
VVDPARTAQVLCEEVCKGGADALVLQEADEEVPPHRGLLDLPRIEAETALSHVHAGPGRRWGADSHGFLGTIVFLRPEALIEDVALVDLPGHCHRGAVVVDFILDDRAMRMVGTHLSLSQGLRIAQMRTIGQHLFRRDRRLTLLCGDLNEWRPWGGMALSPRVTGLALRGPAPATFPTRWPVLPLDRVMVSAPARVTQARVLDGPGIRMASDHRPLRAEIALGPA